MPVHLEFLITPPSEAAPAPGSERPNAPRRPRPAGRGAGWRGPLAYGPPTTRGSVPHCRTPDHTDHKTVVRRVHYPWYPLYGQDVIVHGSRKGSQGVLVCQVHDDGKGDHREVPTWMFDAVRCARMVPVSPPQVCWAALLDLRRLLEEAQPQEVPAPVEDRCPSTTEGTDETPTGATPTQAPSRPVRSATPSATMAGPSPRDAADGDGPARAITGRSAGAPPRGGGA